MINLSYCASTADRPFSNFGDALSPIVVSLLSNEPINHVGFDSGQDRLVAIGTILQNIDNGNVGVWGTGLDIRVSNDTKGGFYSGPKSKATNLKLHCTRGRLTSVHLETLGFEVNNLYGDPAVLLKIFLKNFKEQEQSNVKGKIGLVCHFSEFVDYTPESKIKPDRLRYHNLNPSEFSIISTLTSPNPASVIKKVLEIGSYDYILSTSLHGLIIADIFNKPSALLTDRGETGVLCNFDFDKKIDHRFRDYHSGLDLPFTPVISCKMTEQLNYNSCKSFLEHLPDKSKQIDASICNLIDSFPYKVSNTSSVSQAFIDSIDVPV